MAIGKRITLPNGVAVNYHRVVSVNTITNVQNIIEVASYTSKDKRAAEQNAIAAGDPMDVFIHTSIILAPYDKTIDIDAAYDYVKTLPEYEGATDEM